MKYIRTKYELGILVESNKDIKDKYGDYLKKGCYFKTWFSPYTEREDIIRQADTIEELCDEVVVKETWRDRPIVIQVCGCSDLFVCARGLYLGKPTTESIKGAIWTDKGLQFVARMNNEGVLELI